MIDINYEEVSKKLLSLMQMGTILKGRDGHIWIDFNWFNEDDLVEILLSYGVEINTKIYGGVIEALDTIDRALELAGETSLLERFNPDIQFFGNRFGPDESRIHVIESRMNDD